MNKHTPGPWKLYNGYEHKKVIRFTRIGNDADTVLSAADPEDELLAINEADLRLIAAAPELLEALNGMIEMFDAVSKKINWGKSFLGANEISKMNNAPIEARVAIAKAKGESCPK